MQSEKTPLAASFKSFGVVSVSSARSQPASKPQILPLKVNVQGFPYKLCVFLRVMARVDCDLTCCSPPWPPPYRYQDLAFALAGTVAFLVDFCVDVWTAARYLKAGDYYWGGLVLLFLFLSSVTTQFFSWAWYQSDLEDVKQELPKRQTLLTLHILQLGYLYRCFHVLKVGFRVCQMEAATDVQRGYAIFLSHDVSLLRLFETFMEGAPQLTLVLYIILHTGKAEVFQLLGICTSLVCIAWALLDYHQSLRSFLQDKHSLDRLPSFFYFLWNFLLVCPRILCLAVFALLFPSYIFIHFFCIWFAMFLWVSLQGTDFMEHDISEWFYRAMVGIILYFCWFNVAEGKTCHRSVIYHTFLFLDNVILATSWLWNNVPFSFDFYVVLALVAALPCYMLGIIVRSIYYKCFHPTLQALPPAFYDEIDGGEAKSQVSFRKLVVGHVNHQIDRTSPANHRTYRLSQNFFSGTSSNRQYQGNGTSRDSRTDNCLLELLGDSHLHSEENSSDI
uniref:XK-related protein n=1 Tax=Salvator merianae TaxID=96440 RepID=A0A8D0B8W3_SALMN